MAYVMAEDRWDSRAASASFGGGGGGSADADTVATHATLATVSTAGGRTRASSAGGASLRTRGAHVNVPGCPVLRIHLKVVEGVEERARGGAVGRDTLGRRPRTRDDAAPVRAPFSRLETCPVSRPPLLPMMRIRTSLYKPTAPSETRLMDARVVVAGKKEGLR